MQLSHFHIINISISAIINMFSVFEHKVSYFVEYKYKL